MAHIPDTPLSHAPLGAAANADADERTCAQCRGAFPRALVLVHALRAARAPVLGRLPSRRVVRCARVHEADTLCSYPAQTHRAGARTRPRIALFPRGKRGRRFVGRTMSRRLPCSMSTNPPLYPRTPSLLSRAGPLLSAVGTAMCRQWTCSRAGAVRRCTFAASRAFSRPGMSHFFFADINVHLELMICAGPLGTKPSAARSLSGASLKHLRRPKWRQPV